MLWLEAGPGQPPPEDLFSEAQREADPRRAAWASSTWTAGCYELCISSSLLADHGAAGSAMHHCQSLHQLRAPFHNLQALGIASLYPLQQCGMQLILCSHLEQSKARRDSRPLVGAEKLKIQMIFFFILWPDYSAFLLSFLWGCLF